MGEVWDGMLKHRPLRIIERREVANNQKKSDHHRMQRMGIPTITSMTPSNLSRSIVRGIAACCKPTLLGALALVCFGQISQAQPTGVYTVSSEIAPNADWSTTAEVAWTTNNGNNCPPTIYPSAPASLVSNIAFELATNANSALDAGTLTTNADSTQVSVPTAFTWAFNAYSLTVDSGTILNLGATTPAQILNWGGTPDAAPLTGLILSNGAVIDAVSTAALTNTGVITWGPDSGGGTVFQTSAAFGSTSMANYVWMPTQLSGYADLAIINNPTNAAAPCILFGTNGNNAWAGTVQVRSGYFQAAGYYPLGLGGVTVDPQYSPSVNPPVWMSSAPAGPAIFEPLTDITIPGSLVAQNGGVIVLHQDVAVGSATIDGNPLPPGAYYWANLNIAYPDVFAAPGSGSLIVGTVDANATPATPVNVGAFSGSGFVTISWEGAGNAENYIVERSTTLNGTNTTIATLANDAHSYTDTAVTNGDTYYYEIAASNPNGLSAASSPAVVGAPNPPVGGIAAVDSWWDTVTLSWTAYPGAKSYDIYAGGAATGPFSLIAAGITNNTYDYVVDTGMPAASNYFSVQAVTSNSISGNSAIVGALEGLTLVEEWNGMGLTSGSPTNGAAVSEWDGNFQGTAATADLANSPLLLLNATPAGAPAVHFNQAAQAELYVDGADSPVTGLSSFSELLVFRATLPGTGAGLWTGMTGLTSAEIGGTANDWGAGWNANDHICFGIGDPETTDECALTNLLGGFHAAVMVWDPVNSQIRMSVDNLGSLIFTIAPPANPRSASAGIHIGNWSGGASGGYFFQGDIAEIGIVNGPMPASMASNVIGQYLIPAYGYEFNVSARNPSRGVFALDWPAYSGAIYKVLSTTNLSVPRTNWTVVATITNSLDAATLSFTNANATNQDRFYQIFGS